MTDLKLTTTTTLNDGSITAHVYEDVGDDGSGANSVTDADGNTINYDNHDSVVLSGGSGETNSLTGFDGKSGNAYYVRFEFASPTVVTDDGAQIDSWSFQTSTLIGDATAGVVESVTAKDPFLDIVRLAEITGSIVSFGKTLDALRSFTPTAATTDVVDARKGNLTLTTTSTTNNGSISVVVHEDTNGDGTSDATTTVSLTGGTDEQNAMTGLDGSVGNDYWIVPSFSTPNFTDDAPTLDSVRITQKGTSGGPISRTFSEIVTIVDGLTNIGGGFRRQTVVETLAVDEAVSAVGKIVKVFEETIRLQKR